MRELSEYGFELDIMEGAGGGHDFDDAGLGIRLGERRVRCVPGVAHPPQYLRDESERVDGGIGSTAAQQWLLSVITRTPFAQTKTHLWRCRRPPVGLFCRHEVAMLPTGDQAVFALV